VIGRQHPRCHRRLRSWQRRQCCARAPGFEQEPRRHRGHRDSGALGRRLRERSAVAVVVPGLLPRVRPASAV